MPELQVDSVERQDRTAFGFWVYLMTDCILFASLFAVYAALHRNTAGGASGADIFKIDYVLAETLILLSSSLTCGLFMLAAHRKDLARFKLWLGATFVLGASFLLLELIEFRQLVVDGDSWRHSAFLSSYFTLVGTHGLHIIIGLLWIGVMFWRIAKRGLDASSMRKLTMLSLFWHFLDIIWICIFSFVYLAGLSS